MDAILSLINPEWLVEIAGEAVKQDYFKFTVAFLLASWVHSGRVKKGMSQEFLSIRNQLGSHIGELVSGLRALCDVLKEDLKSQREMIGVLTTDVSALKNEMKEIKTLVEKPPEKKENQDARY